MLSSPDADFVQREPALPGLRTLLDPDAIVRAAVAAGITQHLGEARPVYMRYKPGTSCLVGYSSAEKQEPTLFYATAFQPNSAKLAKAAERKRAKWLDGGGRYVIDPLAIELCIFPNDDHLPVLIDLLSPEKGAAFIRDRIGQPLFLPPAEVRVLAYKPERRCTLAVFSEGRPGSIAKAYSSGAYAGARERAAALPTLPRLGMQRLLSADDKKRLLFFEWLNGRSLGEAILLGEAADVDVRVTGSGLAELHLAPAPALPARTSAQRRLLDELVSTLRVIYPNVSNAAASVAARATSLLLLDDSAPVFIHGDFYAQQVLLHENEISLIDLDEAATGSAAFDLGNFIAHLELDAACGKLSRESVATQSQNFLDGYEFRRALPPARVIAAHTAASLLALAHQPFRRHLPDWQRVTAAIVARAGEILDVVAGQTGFARSKRYSPRKMDDAMPWLSDALDPAIARETLDRRVEWEGQSAHVSKVRSAKLVRHKPGRRCVIAYDLEVERNGSTFCETLIGKSRARGIDRATYEILRALRESGFSESDSDGIAVPEPRGKVSQFNMWLSSKAGGVPATSFVFGSNATQFAERVADAAHKLHASSVTPDRVHAMTDELRILEQRLHDASQRRPDLAERIEDLGIACRRLATGVVSDEISPIHRDFYGDQLLMDGDRTWILDLDLFCMGDPALDIGNFLGHVTEIALRTLGDPTAGVAFERALLDRYSHLAGDSIVERAEMFRTLTLARQVWVSTEKPERSTVTEPLLELCEARVSADTRTIGVFQ